MNNTSNIKIEKIILCSIIENPKLLDKFYNRINSFLFSATNNRLIFEVIQDLHSKNKPIDYLFVDSEITKKGLRLNVCLAEIMEVEATTTNFEYYLMVLIENTVKKDFIAKFNKLLKLANKQGEDIYDIRDKAFAEFNSLFIDRFIEANKSDIPFSDLVQKVEDKFSKIEFGTLPGIPSSLKIINKAFGGWLNSDLTVVAGRPGMGKTAFMVQQIIDITTQGMSVGVFSLEMSAEQITSRIITNYTEIPNSSILRKGLLDNEWEQYNLLKGDLLRLRVHIDDTPGITIQDLRVKAKMMKMRYNISILLIDYLQLVTDNSQNRQNREQEVSIISRSLKALAKELDIPVIALAQLSRYVEQRADKRPLLSDLRDSGAIEQDADEVMFLYRPEYYGIEQWDDDYDNELTKNQLEIIIAKNRHGGTLSERYNVNLAISKFMNID